MVTKQIWQILTQRKGLLIWKRVQTKCGPCSQGNHIRISSLFYRAIIVLMQLGFAFLEGGCVRYKNLQSIMIKVFANAAISIIMTWIVTFYEKQFYQVGYGLMFGTNDKSNFLGTDLFAAKGFDEHPHNFSRFGKSLFNN